MFTYFHRHKFSYAKGQIAPIMILVLVILIIMAMVTVNLYKVAMDKTYSANSVDAGALAAGSVMANVFNALGSANAEMKKGYELAFYSITASLTLALLYISFASISAGTSMGLATTASAISGFEPCDAAGLAAEAALAAKTGASSMKTVSTAITSAIIATSTLYAAQLYFYGKLRTTAREGRDSAMEQGHKFLFYNGGVGSRLPESIPDGSSWSKSRKDFSRFMDSIKYADTYRFDWQDGQGRAHFAESRVTTAELDAFDLIVAAMPFPMLIGGLFVARGAALAATAFLIVPGTGAAVYYGAGAKLFKAACAVKNACHHPACKVVWRGLALLGKLAVGAGRVAASSAIGSMATASVPLIAVRFGLLPLRGVPVRDSSIDVITIMFLICWIDDVIHDRRLRVESTLSQEGADLGLVKTEYPVVQSYSVVDFRGNGKILPAKSEDLSFDASIIETDVIGKK